MASLPIVGVVLLGLTTGCSGAAMKDADIGNVGNNLKFECTTEGFFPYPGDCTKFIQCADGTTVSYSCDPDLHFSESSGMCDWPQVANCEWANDADMKVEQMKIPHGQGCMRPEKTEYICFKDGAYPHETSCSHFYDCWQGNATLCRCATGYLFDIQYLGCNYPEMVDCGERSLRHLKTTDVPESRDIFSRVPNEFRCPRPLGIYSNPAECTSFYICFEGVSRKEDCPTGLVFNQKRNYCDDPANVPDCITMDIFSSNFL